MNDAIVIKHEMSCPKYNNKIDKHNGRYQIAWIFFIIAASHLSIVLWHFDAEKNTLTFYNLLKPLGFLWCQFCNQSCYYVF